ncbi:MAG TPA: hypothetical protein PKI62_08055 [bacterium]|nr:hypothetical protein [bacterium]
MTEHTVVHRRSIRFLLTLITFTAVLNSPAGVRLTFVPSKELVREVILENDSVRFELLIDRGVYLAGMTEKSTGVNLMAGNPPLLFLSVRLPWDFPDVGYQIFSVQEQQAADRVSVTVRQECTYVENPLPVEQTFSLGTGRELAWSARMTNTSTGGRTFRDPESVASTITLPFLQKLVIGQGRDTHYLLPTQRDRFCIDSPRDFIFYFTSATDPKMPIDLYDLKARCGVYLHVVQTALDLDFADYKDFKSRIFRLVQKPGETTLLLEARIGPHPGDWHAAYYAFRNYIRSGFDFTFYKRPVQEKYRQRFVSHFTFMYGKDIYDPAANRLRIDEFLDEGQLNFGGYDYMLLWHDYPRMGIDNRDQMDMYEDLPGGLVGLKQMVERAHARGVQVFIPYKPWDIMKGRTDRFTQEARVAGAIGSDGVFLDTMDESDQAFRAALDGVNPDNVFVSEGRPDLKAAQLVTGSWNQSGDATNKMPNVDLFRFILPEHNVHNINRSARTRHDLVLNALFNGVGFIVWEDIFGEINRYSWDERILIQRYSRIIHENRDAYLTGDPVPLVSALRRDLFVNAFPVADKCIYPMYQLGRDAGTRLDPKRLVGPFMEVPYPPDWHYIDLWNHQPIAHEVAGGKVRLISPEEPADAMSCIVALPKNLTVRRDGKRLTIEALHPVAHGEIHLQTVDNLTMMEQPLLILPGTRAEVDLDTLKIDFPYLLLVKLMQDGVLKDEIIINLGWKQF